MKNIIKNRNFNRHIRHYVKQNNINGLCDVDINKKEQCKSSKYASQFKDLEVLGNKSTQYKNAVKYLKEKPYFLPETIPFSKGDILKLKGYFDGNQKWIVKPENGLKRKGIGVFESYSKLEEFVFSYPYGKWILQEFIDNPLLIDGKKFHFRVYVLNIKDTKNQTFKTLMYDRGFMYFSTEDYINKTNKSLLTDGKTKNQVKQFPQYFNKHHNIFEDTVLPQFKMIINDTTEAVYKNLECINKNICYKYLGYDILIDKYFRCYLAEINTNVIGIPHASPKFKRRMYTSILDAVIKNSNQNFVFVNKFNKPKRHKQLIEDQPIKRTGFTSLNKYLIIFILIVIMVCFVCILNYFNM